MVAPGRAAKDSNIALSEPGTASYIGIYSYIQPASCCVFVCVTCFSSYSLQICRTSVPLIAGEERVVAPARAAKDSSIVWIHHGTASYIYSYIQPADM